MERRTFIKHTTIGCGSILIALSCENPQGGTYHFFTTEEAPCIMAICEQIIPADKDPGATDAGVIHYIDQELTDFYKGHQKMYRNGLMALQASCNELHGKRFEELGFEEQTEFLMDMEKSALPHDKWGNVKQDAFFQTLRKHTVEGFYSNPQHGGNKDYTSFKMMRIESPYLF